MSWFHRTKVGRIISRMTSDIEDVRVGVQDVLFVSLVQLGQMGVAAAAMLWYDGVLFLIVLGLAPVIWLINWQFHCRLSVTLRQMRESFSRVVATLAESVVGAWRKTIGGSATTDLFRPRAVGRPEDPDPR